jgi:hypothetical protein
MKSWSKYKRTGMSQKIAWQNIIVLQNSYKGVMIWQQYQVELYLIEIEVLL